MAPQCSKKGALAPLQTLEGCNIIFIMLLNTKAVIEFHKDPLHEYHL